ncbi:DNA-directed RNA polymerase subunit beta [Aquisalibacillus elongatus]|uniref:DNA-directed RNA polymerase subunit beta n=1 Tax=Aquisalibacillus elongatus TaxID=485577 RepID=A0A3N5BAZ5_9BACI|nr:DNA-directed RNA polymerase subunit beta [Aquisalibacillus elongatus]RPF54129.1 DNA-directed RNA polymerase subunit beta [Aquisalibacillus elongatus]
MASEDKNKNNQTDSSSAEDTKKRKLRKKQLKEEKKKDKQKGPIRRFISTRIRFIPVWLRVIIVIALCFVAFYVGLGFGFSSLGEGEDPDTVRSLEFWRYIWDYIQGEPVS